MGWSAHRRRAVGLGFLCVAVALLYSAEWSGKSYFPLESENAAVLVSEALNVIAYTACALLWRPFERTFLGSAHLRAGALVLAGAGATLGRALIAASGSGAATSALGWAGVALHSLCEPALLLACLCVLCRDDPRRAAAVLPCAFMLAGLAITLQQVAGLALGAALVVAGPLLSAGLLLLAMRTASPGQPSGAIGASARDNREPAHHGGPSHIPLWTFVLMVAYDLVYHLIITVDTATSSYGMLGLVALSGFALALALVKGSEYSPLALNKAALPCVVAALACLPMSSPGPELAALFSNTGSAAFYLFALITFIMMCQRHEYVAARSLGAFLAVEHVGHLLGDLVGQAFNQAFPSGGMPLQVFSAIVATAMVLVATLFFNDLDVARVFGLVPQWALGNRRAASGAGREAAGDSAASEGAGAANVLTQVRPARAAGGTPGITGTGAGTVVSVMSARESVAWQCASVARKHSLTVREEEVLELMILGLDNAQIAEELTVSLGTVKAHVSHICRKLGAGSRQEATQIALRS